MSSSAATSASSAPASSSSSSSSSSVGSSSSASCGADITQRILNDHAWFRQQFADGDELRAAREPSTTAHQLAEWWQPLAYRLDVHAAAEEKIFYPLLLAKGKTDPKEETLDAIKDHNKIRDGVRDAAKHIVGSDEWWAAVTKARVENDEHMAEEENEGLADFRLNVARAERLRLGEVFTRFMNEHRGMRGIDDDNKDPKKYVAAVEKKLAGAADTNKA